MGNDDGCIKRLELEHEDYRLELNDCGCDGDDETDGPYLTFEAEDESATLSRDHVKQLFVWLLDWHCAH